MTASSRRRITLLLSLNIFATGAGWLMIGEVTGNGPTSRFLYTGFALALAITGADAWLHRSGQTRALGRLLSRGTMLLPFIWLVSSLLLPLFWVETVDARTTALSIGLLSWLCGANAVRGFRQFRAAWVARGPLALAEHYQQPDATIDWEAILASLRVQPAMYVPLMNRFTLPLAAVAGIGGMMFGPVLVYSSPLSAALGWTFAVAFLLSYFVQLLGSGAAQALALVRLEKAAGRPLAPRFAEDARRPRSRKGQRRKR